jgi:hypothetical protein
MESRLAGYTEKDGNHHGPRLMANDGVRKRVAELNEQRRGQPLHIDIAC